MNIKKQNLSFNVTDTPKIINIGNESQIVDIPNEQILENNNQNFKIHEDTIEQLAERILKDGQLSPCIVSPLPDGNYELVDGRHRRRAIIKAGLPTTKCIIKNDLTDTQKATYRITLNIFRNNDYLPSEMALSLKELVDLEGSHNAIKKVAEDTSTSRKKIYRYLRLTHLIKPLLDRVDNGNIPLIAAVELSYLTESDQSRLFQFLLNHSDCKITTDIARLVKEAPENLDEIFFQSDDDFDNDFEESENVDNLSTYSEPAVDSSDNAINAIPQDNDYISKEHREIIVKFIISITKIDFYIINLFYDSAECVKYLKEHYIKGHCGGSNEFSNSRVKYDFDSKKFSIHIDNTPYEISYKSLENMIRLYIRDNYSTEDIISVIQKSTR